MDGDPRDEPKDDMEEWEDVEETLKLVEREQIRGGATFLGEVEGVKDPVSLFRV